MADALGTPRKDAATDVLFSLPSGRALCHNDIHPLNLLLADEGWAAHLTRLRAAAMSSAIILRLLFSMRKLGPACR